MKHGKVGSLHLLIVLLVCVTCITGCAKRESEALFSETVMNQSLAPAPTPASPADNSRMQASNTGGNSFIVPEGRKLIYTATIEMVVPNPSEIAKVIDTELKNFGAYASGQNIWEDSVSYEIRVPVDRLGRFLDLLPNLGKVRKQTIQARDVTDYYYDLENRIKNKRILVERYQSYLKNAKNVEDLLNIEQFLNDATTELESLEGSFKGLVKQVDYATVQLTIESSVRSSTSRPTLWEQLRNLFVAFGTGIQTFIVIIVGILIYGIPLLFVVLLFWWLAFGRIGLVRKLFKFVRAKKPSA